MKHRKRLTEFQVFMILIAIAFVVILTICGIHYAVAAEIQSIEGWVMCQPDSYINIRSKPTTRSRVIGFLYSGDHLFLDGKVKNGFAHCIAMSNEESEGWVYKGFIVNSKPVSDGHLYPLNANGRVACRRAVNGERRRWLNKDEILLVYMVSVEWCLTNQGFVKTECIDLESPMDVVYGQSGYDMTWEDD